jgi:hypothetical protein
MSTPCAPGTSCTVTWSVTCPGTYNWILSVTDGVETTTYGSSLSSTMSSVCASAGDPCFDC